MNHAQAVGTVLEGIVNLVATLEENHRQPGEQLIAVCLDCKPVLPMPFGADGDASEARRDQWVKAHEEGTQHRVIRPERLAADLGYLASRGRLVAS